MSTAEPSVGNGRGLTLLPDVPPLRDSGILLHVGVHKTGTTAIQAALADARPQLVKHDVLYPGKRQAQHRSAMAITNRKWGWEGKGGGTYDRKIFDWLVGKVQGHSGRVVISSEFFCEADAATTLVAAQELGLDRLHVVVTLRSLGQLLPSSYQQYLKYGLTVGYERWLGNVFETPGGTSMTPTFWRRNDHAAVVTRWSDAVGAANVSVLVLDDVDRSAVFRTFEQLLALPPDLLVSRMSLTSNRSMTAAEAEFVRLLNEHVNTDLTWDEYVKYIRRGVALGMVEGREPSPDEPRLHTPDWALDAAAAEGARAAEGIRSTGVRILGDIDALATRSSSPPEVPVAVKDVLPKDAAVQAVITVIEATRENPELTARQLRDELWDRTKQDLRLRWRIRTLRP
jgi:hypothetical protein